MPVIQYSETIPAPAESLFDFTQDYSLRNEWDPFPEHYEFLPPSMGPEPGAVLLVRAKNGHSMTVRYVGYNRPRAAAIEMVSGPWLISKFAGTWLFSSVSPSSTRVTFKYNIVAAPRALAWLIQPLLNRSFLRHARKRIQALRAHVVANELQGSA